MGDDKQLDVSAEPDRQVDIRNAAELLEWAESLGVTVGELKVAVARVGPSVIRILEYLSHKA